ncbi:MAG TPA: Asp-tRNA(Asn)/Glu-tRNA(Gln) amidotransferase subunit GatC [Candidatus Babeliales bacterium]|nr:Asp-tRNA(Asn)/Glu-tRNA(Gln) amidotransferase subunit GatC [Candidatus Babeliales bacterium]
MIKVSKQELLEIARTSRIELKEQEIAGMLKELEDMLSYAERISNVVIDHGCAPHKNVNLFRDDIVQVTAYQALLDQAPDVEQNLFVVPKIIETQE